MVITTLQISSIFLNRSYNISYSELMGKFHEGCNKYYAYLYNTRRLNFCEIMLCSRSQGFISMNDVQESRVAFTYLYHTPFFHFFYLTGVANFCFLPTTILLGFRGLK